MSPVYFNNNNRVHNISSFSLKWAKIFSLLLSKKVNVRGHWLVVHNLHENVLWSSKLIYNSLLWSNILAPRLQSVSSKFVTSLGAISQCTTTSLPKYLITEGGKWLCDIKVHETWHDVKIQRGISYDVIKGLLIFTISKGEEWLLSDKGLHCASSNLLLILSCLITCHH